MLENYYDDFTPGCVFRRNTWKNDTYFLKSDFQILPDQCLQIKCTQI